MFRPAMTIHLAPQPRRFTKADFEPLQLHYDEQVRQIHIMTEYAQRGLALDPGGAAVGRGLLHAEEALLARWMPGKEGRLQRQTTPESWRAIVEDLGNPQQARIVATTGSRPTSSSSPDPARARPASSCIGSPTSSGSSARIRGASRARLQPPRCRRDPIAPVRPDRRRRPGLDDLDLPRARHAARGASFAARSDRVDGGAFDEHLREAIALLRGDGLSREEAEAQRRTSSGATGGSSSTNTRISGPTNTS